MPTTFISDNTKSFKAAVDKITKVSHYLTNKRITWNFIAEKAPWWGIAFGKERCVGSRESIGRTDLRFEELQTLVV